MELFISIDDLETERPLAERLAVVMVTATRLVVYIAGALDVHPSVGGKKGKLNLIGIIASMRRS